VAGEPQPQMDIHKAVSRLFLFVCLFFSSFDETTTELGLDAEGLTETIAFKFGIYLFWFLGFLLFVCFVIPL
jgi:hypothetical protein